MDRSFSSTSSSSTSSSCTKNINNINNKRMRDVTSTTVLPFVTDTDTDPFPVRLASSSLIDTTTPTVITVQDDSAAAAAAVAADADAANGSTTTTATFPTAIADTTTRTDRRTTALDLSVSSCVSLLTSSLTSSTLTDSLSLAAPAPTSTAPEQCSSNNGGGVGPTMTHDDDDDPSTTSTTRSFGSDDGTASRCTSSRAAMTTIESQSESLEGGGGIIKNEHAAIVPTPFRKYCEALLAKDINDDDAIDDTTTTANNDEDDDDLRAFLLEDQNAAGKNANANNVNESIFSLFRRNKALAATLQQHHQSNTSNDSTAAGHNHKADITTTTTTTNTTVCNDTDDFSIDDDFDLLDPLPFEDVDILPNFYAPNQQQYQQQFPNESIYSNNTGTTGGYSGLANTLAEPPATTTYSFCNFNNNVMDSSNDHHHQFINECGQGSAAATTNYTFCNVNSSSNGNIGNDQNANIDIHYQNFNNNHGGSGGGGIPTMQEDPSNSGFGSSGTTKFNQIADAFSLFRRKKVLAETMQRQQQHQHYTSNTTTKETEVAVPPEHITVEDSISKVLLKLSLQERNNTEEEIHGVRSLFKDETPESLNKALYEFDVELLKVKNSLARASIRNTIQDVLRYTVWISSTTTTTAACSSTQQQQDNDSVSSFLQTMHNTNTTTSTSTSTNPNTTTTGSRDDDDCYLNDPNIRLRFLRFEYFDAVKAVTRFVFFLEFTQELFGNFVAERSISIDDFETNKSSTSAENKRKRKNGGNNKKNKQPQSNNTNNTINNDATTSTSQNNTTGNETNEMKTLMNSRFHYLQFRDRSGRRVCVFCGSCLFDVPLKLRYKIIMYMHWIASEDIETQQKGLVMIIWPSHEEQTTATVSRSALKKLKKTSPTTTSGGGGGSCEDQWLPLRSNILNLDIRYHTTSFLAIPIRIASIHYCATNNHPVYKVLSRLFYFGLPQQIKSRYKTHFGEPIEIRYQLQSYGIPVDLLPITHSGAVKMTNHIHAMKFRKQIERHHEHYHGNHQQQQQQHQLRRQAHHVNGTMNSTDGHGVLQGPPKKKTKKEMTITNYYNRGVGDNPYNRGAGEAAAASGSPLSQVPPSVLHELLVECPRSDDVIFRKGKQYGNHVGNSVLLNTLMEHTYLEHYNAKNQGEKVELTWSIVHEIERRGGRFLEWDGSVYNGGAWVHIINDYKKRDKIAQCYKVYTKQRRIQKSRRQLLHPTTAAATPAATTPTAIPITYDGLNAI